MKGILFKAFSLALLVSVVPSFGMSSRISRVTVKKTTTPVKKTTTPDKDQVSVESDSMWNKFKTNVQEAFDSSYGSVKKIGQNFAHYAVMAVRGINTVVTAPYTYTVDLLAKKIDLSNKVSTIDFVKKDTFYSNTILGYAKTLASYVLSLELAYVARQLYRRVRNS